jgi:hypothetical protein
MKRIPALHTVLCVAFLAFLVHSTGAGFIADLQVFAFLILVGWSLRAVIRAVIRALRPVKD